MINKCEWYQNGQEDFFTAQCDKNRGWQSGGHNTVKEMKETYTYCPSCGKLIEFNKEGKNGAI